MLAISIWVNARISVFLFYVGLCLNFPLVISALYRSLCRLPPQIIFSRWEYFKFNYLVPSLSLPTIMLFLLFATCFSTLKIETPSPEDPISPITHASSAESDYYEKSAVVNYSTLLLYVNLVPTSKLNHRGVAMGGSDDMCHSILDGIR